MNNTFPLASIFNISASENYLWLSSENYLQFSCSFSLLSASLLLQLSLLVVLISIARLIRNVQTEGTLQGAASSDDLWDSLSRRRTASMSQSIACEILDSCIPIEDKSWHETQIAALMTFVRSLALSRGDAEPFDQSKLGPRVSIDQRSPAASHTGGK